MYTTSVMVVSTLSSVVEVLGPDHVDSIYPSVFVTALHKGTGGALSAMHASKLISGLLHAACSPTARYCHIICSAPLSWQAGCGSEQGEHAAAVHGRCLRDALARRGLWRAAEHTSAQACVENRFTAHYRCTSCMRTMTLQGLTSAGWGNALME